MATFVTTAEYAKLHGLEVSTVRWQIVRGRIPGVVKFGRDWMVPADAPWPERRQYTRTAKFYEFQERRLERNRRRKAGEE